MTCTHLPGKINLLALVVIVLLPACNDSSPAAPSQYPDVAGTYSGPLVLTTVVNPDDSETLNGTMRLVVTQSGSQVTLNGTITILGTTEEIPPTVGTIDGDGEFTFPGDDFQGAMPDPGCGEVRVTSNARLPRRHGDLQSGVRDHRVWRFDGCRDDDEGVSTSARRLVAPQRNDPSAPAAGNGQLSAAAALHSP